MRLNTTNFIMKIPKKRKLQETVANHLSDTDFKNFLKFIEIIPPEKSYLFLVKEKILSSDKPLIEENRAKQSSIQLRQINC